MKKGTQYTERDNVATCLEPVAAGDVLQTVFAEVTAEEAVPVYHKIALQAIKNKEEIRKYGEIIGAATKDIHAGEHVHIHNMESQRGRGDRK